MVPVRELRCAPWALHPAMTLRILREGSGGAGRRRRLYPASMTPSARRAPGPLVLLPLLVAVACGGSPPSASPGEARDPATAAPTAPPSPEQDAFWAALQAHCGRSYEGRVSDITPYYRPGLEGRRLLIHFRECSVDRMHIPLHVDGDRSRNWILTRVNGTIRLKHDHRHEDGSEDVVTQYGGDAPVPGLATRQIFPADAHTARILPERADNFWFLDLVGPETLQYGVHWPRLGHSVRLEFDLSRPVDTPPDPWGWGAGHGGSEGG